MRIFDKWLIIWFTNDLGHSIEFIPVGHFNTTYNLYKEVAI